MSEFVPISGRRWVVKIGSSLLTADGAGLDRPAIQDWAAQIAVLVEQGIKVVLVSSGSVAEGLSRLGWAERPRALHNLQAAAAVGQMGLVEAWETALQQHDLKTAQVLLTHDDLANRRRYLNARSTLRTLTALGVIPVVNENDTVASDELRFGDNDSLAAMVASLIEAERLVILTDQAGLFDADPRNNPDAELIEHAVADDPAIMAMAGTGMGNLGRGGMRTKVLAAQLAVAAGVETVIAAGKKANILVDIAKGEFTGTSLAAQNQPLAARKQWIGQQLQCHGSLHLDAGATEALLNQGSSLLPIGVTSVQGNFSRGDAVRCINSNGQEIARGLVSYSAAEARKIIGKPSSEIAEILGYLEGDELIHRDSLTLV